MSNKTIEDLGNCVRYHCSQQYCTEEEAFLSDLVLDCF